MAKKRLCEKICRNCIRGIPIGIRNEMLCREKGVVSPDFSCSRFMAFEMDAFQRRLDYRCSDCIHFTFTPDSQNSNFGVCSMFSVRRCDGSLKKACSKFTKRGTRSA